MKERTGLEIAVVGLSGKFPGASNVDEFWQNIKNGKESVTFFSDEELRENGVSEELLNNPRFVKTSGGVLENKEYFDNDFFGYTPIEAAILDPQFRIFHECVWEALEDAGYSPDKYDGQIGLFAGNSRNFDWELKNNVVGRTKEIGAFSSHLLYNRDYLCTTISYKLGLKGPSILVQSACSTSLVAIHMACRSLLTAECNMALAGGVTIKTWVQNGYIYDEALINSPDGHCRAFDKDAQGTVGGEGAGVVALKRLDDAIKDGDHIYAIIRGSSVNNDGDLKVGISAPSIDGQSKVIKSAMKMSRTNPESISYIEAHGTGTKLGDPIEIKALSNAFNLQVKENCAIGSVKANIGHLDAAAGVAGFIKTVLALYYKQIPPSINFTEPNPKIRLNDTPFYVNTKLKNWEKEKYPRRAGVSSFGIGGTNAHVILEERIQKSDVKLESNYELLILSAKSKNALMKSINNVLAYLESSNENIQNIAYTTQVGRKDFEHRFICTAKSKKDLIESLTNLDFTNSYNLYDYKGTQKTIFMFPGQGAQYIDMAKKLYESEAYFKDTVDKCFGIVKEKFNIDLKKVLFPENTNSDTQEVTLINRTDYTQPLLFITEYALADLLMKLGIKAYAMIGHSIGEYVAACLAEVFTLEDALTVVIKRGQLMQRLPEGAMLSIYITEQELNSIIDKEINVAAINAENQIVVSGTFSDIEKLSIKLKEKNIFFRQLKTSHAFHSHMMDGILDEFKLVFNNINLRPPQIPFISNRTGDWINDEVFTSKYWVKHLRETVLFLKGIETIKKSTEGLIFIEVGPSKSLSSLLTTGNEQNSDTIINLLPHPKDKVNDYAYFLESVGKLWLNGVKISWVDLNKNKKRFRVPLPKYPFDRKRYWIDINLDDIDFSGVQLGSNKKNTIDEWFYLPQWNKTHYAQSFIQKNTVPVNDVLIFSSNKENVNSLSKKFDSKGVKLTVIEGLKSGVNYNSKKYDKYSTLFQDLFDSNIVPDTIIYFLPEKPDSYKVLNVDSYEDFVEKHYYNLLEIVKEYSKLQKKECRLFVIANGLIKVNSIDQINPLYSLLTGCLKVIPLEYKNFTCRLIDLDVEINEEEIKYDADSIFSEIKLSHNNNIIAIRGREKYIPEFKQIQLPEVNNSPACLKKDGNYIITGGTGGIGLEIVEYLSNTGVSRIFLLSRKEIPDKNTWEEYKKDKTSPESIKNIINKLSNLESKTTEIITYSVDVSSLEEMKNVINEIKLKYGNINGVFHAAGIGDGKVIALRDKASSEKVFSPKVKGTLVLNEIFKEESLDFLMLFSSINSLIGAIGQIAYCSANSFLDAYANNFENSTFKKIISVNWDAWKEVGMAFDHFKNLDKSSKDELAYAINSKEGKEVLNRILKEDFSQVIISTRSLEDRLTAAEKNQDFDIFEKDANKKIENESKKPRPNLKEKYCTPETEAQKKLATLFEEFFGIEGIGINDDFFELGGDSLKAMWLLSRINKTIELDIPITVFFSNPTIKSLSEQFDVSDTIVSKIITCTEKKEYYPQSSAQKRLYFLDQLEDVGTSYNMTFVLKINGHVDISLLNSVFQKLVDRHEAFRTSFHEIKRVPVQQVHKNVDFNIVVDDNQAKKPVNQIVKDFVQPFKLDEAPLLRIHISDISKPEKLFLIDMHHIISDGSSIEVFMNDFIKLYNNQSLANLAIDYKDFSNWQNNLIKQGVIDNQKNYWLNVYKEPVPRLQLPIDYERPPVFDYKGDLYNFTIPEKNAKNLKELSSRTGTTLFMNLLNITSLILHKYTSQDDIVIGCSIAGRSHADLENTIGMFINELAIRNKVDKNSLYREFLEDTKKRCLEAFENQDYQFEELVENLNLERDSSRNPLFDVCLVLNNYEVSEKEIENFSLIPYDLKNTSSKFDLTFYYSEAPNGDLELGIEYSTSLFKKDTIARYATHVNYLISNILQFQDKPLIDIEIVTENEKARILNDFNVDFANFPKEKTIVQLFEERVELNPNSIAVTNNNKQNTYKELDFKSNQIAHYLKKECNTQNNDIIGILLNKSIECITVILGILKAGNAYLPIDIGNPKDRIKKIVEDAKIKVLLSERKYIKLINELQWECTSLEIVNCIDSYNIKEEDEAEKNSMMDAKLWEYIANSSDDDISSGGWISSYTGKPIPKSEMDEYALNAESKILKLVDSNSKVLEIGCASGLTMYKVAPKVKLFVGTDLSGPILDKNREKIKTEGIKNIKLSKLFAHEISNVEERDFDLIIINSVIQHFHGYNYLRKVIQDCIQLLSDKGSIFIGDIMDLDQKENLIQDLIEFKNKNTNGEYRTKTDWSNELFISKNYFQDLRFDFPEINKIDFTDKIGTIQNELTKFRYDAVITVNKRKLEKSQIAKNKFQHDHRNIELQKISSLEIQISPEDLAYIIYTSGTTGTPKGSMISHQNVVRLMTNDDFQFSFSKDDVWTMFHSYNFDFSVWEMYGALLYGGKLVIIDNKEARDSELFIRTLQKQEVSVLNQTPSAFYNLMNQILDNPYNKFNLRYIIFGGEALSFKALAPWKKRYPGIKLINMFGITETTVHVTYKEIEESDIRLNKSNIGKAIPTLKTYILDENLKLVPIGIAGELCVGGYGVCKGYLNNEKLIEEKFILNPFNDKEILYRSGDLARYLSNGEIEYLGRIDKQVKIRGFRIEPGEIEKKLLQIESITKAKVISRENASGDKLLYAYLISGKEYKTNELVNLLKTYLPDYMIPTYYFYIEEFPLTSNGKIDINELPTQRNYIREDYIPPQNEAQIKLVEIWSDILSIPKDTISIDSNFFELGGHSLKATLLVSSIHKNFNVKIPLSEVFKRTTIKYLSEVLKLENQIKFESLKKTEKKEYYSISSAQKRIYFTHQHDPENVTYNIPFFFEIDKVLSDSEFYEIFSTLINKHSILRTRFIEIKGKPVQQICDYNELEIEYFNISDGISVEEIIRNFVRPFNLSDQHLIRFGVIRSNNNHQTLMLDVHHIIADGISLNILLKELTQLLGSNNIEQSKYQYIDYSEYQNQSSNDVNIKTQKNYWLNQFNDLPTVLDLPTDFIRPSKHNSEGSNVNFEIAEETYQKLMQMSLDKGVSLYMFLFSIFNIFLSKICGKEDIVVGTPSAGRRHSDVNNIIGMFVNTLAVRSDLDNDMSFNDFLLKTKDNILGAFENQEYQFDDLVENIGLKRHINRNPLFDTMFTLNNIEELSKEAIYSLTGITEINGVDYSNATSKFDMTLSIFERENKLRCVFEYKTCLFKEESIQRFANYYMALVNNVLSDTECKLKDLQILDNKTKSIILEQFSIKVEDFPKRNSIGEIFRKTVLEFPDRIALQYQNQEISYKSLDERTNQVANYLKGIGVKQGEVVGIYEDDSVNIITAIYGIIKLGAIYLPLDMKNPRTRIEYLLKDSGAQCVIVSAESEVEFDPNIKTVSINNFVLDKFSIEFSQDNISNRLAYIIYTSGTTGKPKGTLIEHHSVIRIVKNTNYVLINENDIIVQISNYCFDGSVFDIFGSLLNGAKLVLIRKQKVLDTKDLGKIIVNQKATVSLITTALFNHFIDNHIETLKGMRKVLLGGERVSKEHVHKAFKYLGKNKLVHLYGPTESTVYASFYEINSISENDPTIPIGIPISNTSILILDSNLNITPIGVEGEIYIGLDGLSRGYLNNPDLTNEKFILNPFNNKERLFKTGDIGKWLPTGDIEFIFRADHQIKLRGFRIELGEIEHQIKQFKEIKEVVVILNDDQEKCLIAYFVARSKISKEEIKKFLAESLPNYMIPSYFVQMDEIPLNLNGKVDTKVLPIPEIDRFIEYIAPKNEIEKKLVKLFGKILNSDSNKISVDENFFDIGGHSLKAMTLLSEIKECFSVKIPLKDFFEGSTIKEVSDYILKANKILDKTKIISSELKEYYTASVSQKRLYFNQKLNTDDKSFNVSMAFIVKGELDRNRFESALQKLINRHKSLRTSFIIIENEIVQRINRAVKPRLTYINGNEKEATQTIKDFIKPFVLSEESLMRIGLIETESEKSYLVLDMHHIISDEISNRIIFNDFIDIYNNNELSPLEIQYIDLCESHNSLKKQDILKSQQIFWEEYYDEYNNQNSLPYDYSKEDNIVNKGNVIQFSLEKIIIDELNKIKEKHNTSIFIVILSIFNILLSKIINHNDIVVGSPITGRENPSLKNIVGFLVNTMAIRNIINKQDEFADFLNHVKDRTLEAFDNNSYDTLEIINRISKKGRDKGKSLFDIMYTYNIVENSEKSLSNLNIEPFNIGGFSSQCDLKLRVIDYDNKLSFAFEYNENLFDKDKIDRYVKYFKKIINEILLNPEIKINDIYLTTETDKERLKTSLIEDLE